MMKPSDLQWVGQPVFKLAMDCHGHETQIRGKVVKYCPSSARYLLMYADGVNEQRLKVKNLLNATNQPYNLLNDSSEEKRQTLLATLDGCMDQRSMGKTEDLMPCTKLFVCVRAVEKMFMTWQRRRRVQWKRNHFVLKNLAVNLPHVALLKPLPLLPALDLRVANTCASFYKEQHAPHKREQKARKPRSLRPKKTPTCRRIEEDSLPEKVPVVVDLTGDGSEEEDDEEIDDTPSARRRLHFGLNSTVLFDMRDSVDVFSWQLTRTGHDRRKLPKQNLEACKSVLKTSTRQESYEWGID
ncbi:hypothetical protein JG687_00004218 [Phytophthora cactorum]|uniref:Uncharacterized protein n=1 Tax=Phytophthora cactorum TaxID=29920 RepID=A0A8T1UTR8_9STRA|nr:hypothetical protein JG687_00004218 [Phytophthora cactorum]